MVSISRPKNLPTPCSMCTTGDPIDSSFRFRMIWSLSKLVRRPCFPIIGVFVLKSLSQIAITSSVMKPFWSDPVRIALSVRSMALLKDSVADSCRPWFLNFSSSISLLPSDSATRMIFFSWEDKNFAMSSWSERGSESGRTSCRSPLLKKDSSLSILLIRMVLYCLIDSWSSSGLRNNSDGSRIGLSRSWLISLYRWVNFNWNSLNRSSKPGSRTNSVLFGT